MAPMQEAPEGVNNVDGGTGGTGSQGRSGAEDTSGKEVGKEALCSNRQTSKGWTFVFPDPTFGGECPYIPMRVKRPSEEWCVPPLIKEALPAGVQEMLFGGTPEDESPAAAGSGAKAAEYLRRLSNDSGSGLSGSGLSDGSSFGASTPRDKKKPKDKSGLSDSGSGFSDVSDKEEAGECRYGSEKSGNSKKSRNSKNSQKSSEKKSVDGHHSDGGSIDNEKNSVTSVPAPLRENRRADTIVPDKKEDEEKSDSDLLSNPFATDSEEEQEEERAPMESARSPRSNKSEKSPRSKKNP